MTKYCKKCKKITDHAKKNGCGICHKRRMKEWHAKNPESGKIWYAKNREHAKAVQKKWIAKNPERVKAKQQRFYAKNPNRVKAIHEKWKNKNTATYLLGFCRARAKRCKRSFSLTLSWIENQLALGTCKRTGLPFNFKQGNYDILGGRNPWFPSIDRIDSDLDYTETNCQIVCSMYNFAKQTWSDTEVLKMARALVEYSQKDPLN